MKKLLLLGLLLLLPSLTLAEGLLVVGSGGSGLWAPPVGLKGSCLVNASPVTITADALLADDGTTAVIFRGVSFIADINTAGPAANGRDQAGAFTVNSWVYLHAIWGTGNIVAGLWSASQTAPTLPTGYSHFALLTAGYTKSAGVGFAHAFTVSSTQNCCYHNILGDTGVRVLNGGSSATRAALVLTALVPPNARYVNLATIANSSSAITASYLGVDGLTDDYLFFSQIASATGTWFAPMVLTTSQTIYYLTQTNASFTIYVTGWSF